MDSVNQETEKSSCTSRFRCEISALFAGVVWSALWAWAVITSGNPEQDIPLWIAAWGAGVAGSLIKPGKVLQLWVLSAALLLIGIGQWFWGMAFYCGFSGVPERRCRLAWCAGIISGGLFGCSFNIFREVIGVLTAFQIARSFPGGNETECRPLLFKIWHQLSAIVVLLCAVWMLNVKPLNSFYPTPGPAAVVSALGLCSNPGGEMLIVAPAHSFQIADSPVVRLLAGRIKHTAGVPLNAGKFNVVMAAGNLSSPGRLLNLLEADGVLVLPVELCRKLPQFHWYTLPGSDELPYAAASLNGRIDASPENIEKNLLAMFPGDESRSGLLPGAISGALAGCTSTSLTIESAAGIKQYKYLLFAAVIALLLLEMIVDRFQPALAAAGSGCGAFALLAGMALRMTEYCNIPYINCSCLLLLLLALAAAADLPLRRCWLRCFIVCMLAAMWLWFFRPSVVMAIIFALLALIVLASSGQLWRTEPPLERIQLAYVLLVSAGAFILGEMLSDCTLELFIASTLLLSYRLLRS